jgi:hypothetical protein
LPIVTGSGRNTATGDSALGEVEGKRYTHAVVIDGGKVWKRKKRPSKQFREMSCEEIPISIA